MSTLKAQINAVAPFADLTPRAITLLQRFFLEESSDEEEEELAEWMHASDANNTLFDLLIDLNEYGPGASTMYMLTKHAKKQPLSKLKRYMGYLGLSLLLVILILLIDEIIGVRLFTWMVTGERPIRSASTKITVVAGDQPKTIWLYDSTRVDLYPHSSLIYPQQFVWDRTVELKGSARFVIKSTVMGKFRVEWNKNWAGEAEWGILELLEDSGKYVVMHQINNLEK